MNILTVDGGGMKGMIPCGVLSELEKKSGKQCYQIFDLIAGTSIGGILACILALGIPAEDAMKFFTEDGPNIFKKGFLTNIKFFFSPKYSADVIEKALKARLGQGLVQDVKTKILLTSYNNSGSGSPFFFKSYDTKSSLYPIWMAARATSAAPMFFPAFKINNDIILSDGGLVANDPTMCAYADAKKLAPGERIKVFSIGTGETDDSFDANSIINAGVLKTGIHAIHALYDGPNEEIKYQARTLIGTDYYRIDPNLIESISMDDASNVAIEKLKAALASTVAQNDSLISAVALNFIK